MRTVFTCLALLFVASVSAGWGNAGAVGAVFGTVVDGGTVLAKGNKFLAEVARTPNEHARGLMYRQQLKSNFCMFFVYEEDSYRPIWMKNCLIALDVAWVSADGTVVEIAERVAPCSPLLGDDCPSFGGKELSRHFVEFSAGTIKRIGLKVGDKIGWDLHFSNGKSSRGGLEVKH